MTPTQARQHGREWRLSLSRAEAAGDVAAVEVYLARMREQLRSAGDLAETIVLAAVFGTGKPEGGEGR